MIVITVYHGEEFFSAKLFPDMFCIVFCICLVIIIIVQKIKKCLHFSVAFF